MRQSSIVLAQQPRAEQLAFNGGGSRDAALLKVPLIPAGFVKVNTPLTVEITVENDVTIGKTVDSDISFGVRRY